MRRERPGDFEEGTNTEHLPEENFSAESSGEKSAEFEIMTDPEQRILLAEAADKLVKESEQKGIKHIIYLDKSARPISTLFSDLWKKRFPDGKKQMPLVNFLNVGSEVEYRLRQIMRDDYRSPLYVGDKDYERWLADLPPEKLIEALGDSELERIKEEYSYLTLAEDDSEALIVEEYTNTGESRELAKKILQTIYPNLRFELFSLSEDGHDLFLDKDGKYHPKWRKRKQESDYGMTGVIDTDGISLTARSFRKKGETQSAEEGNLSRKVAQLRQEMHMIADEYLQKEEEKNKYEEYVKQRAREIHGLIDKFAVPRKDVSDIEGLLRSGKKSKVEEFAHELTLPITEGGLGQEIPDNIEDRSYYLSDHYSYLLKDHIRRRWMSFFE